MWRLNKTTLLLAILSYSYIPLFIFLLGWVKVCFAIPACILFLYFLFRFYLEKRKEVSNIITIHWGIVVSLSLLILVVCVLCGYGGFVNQAWDWIKHNAILQDLYTHSWPVTYMIDGKVALLTYYHGLYLLPALIGKVFHSHFITELSFGIIGYVGLWLMIFSLIYITKANKWYKQLGVFFLFILFAGLVFPLQKICHLVTGEGYCNNWHALMFNEHSLQFRSIFVMLRWVGPQCFTIWLSIILYLYYKDDLQWYVLIALPSLLSGTWAFLGLVFVMIYYASYVVAKRLNSWKKIFTWSNILPVITSGIIFFLYLLQNKVVQGHSTQNQSFGFVSYQGIEWILYVLFVMITYGIYTLVVWYDNRKDILFYVIPLSFILIPLFTIGSETDFCMGVSIPVVILLFIYVAKYIISPPHHFFATIIVSALIICILLGAKYPFAELKNEVLAYGWKIDKNYSQQTMDICFRDNSTHCLQKTGILWENYICQDIEDSIYYKYISKKIDHHD